MSILTMLMAMVIVGAIGINIMAYIPNRKPMPRHSYGYIQIMHPAVSDDTIVMRRVSNMQTIDQPTMIPIQY